MKEKYEVSWKGYSKNSTYKKPTTGAGPSVIFADSLASAKKIVKDRAEGNGYKVTSLIGHKKK